MLDIDARKLLYLAVSHPDKSLGRSISKICCMLCQHGLHLQTTRQVRGLHSYKELPTLGATELKVKSMLARLQLVKFFRECINDQDTTDQERSIKGRQDSHRRLFHIKPVPLLGANKENQKRAQ
jgi:hypothetical protein